MSNDKQPEIRFPGFTEAWEQRKLGEIAQKVSVGIATSSSEYFTDKETGVPFVKNQNVKENWIDDSDLEFITHEFDEANRNKRLKTGDILTVRTGYPGLSAVVPSHLEGAQTFTTLITRLKQETALPEYVSAFINSDAGMKQITGMEAGGAQKNVNAGILQNLLIDLPSLAEQKAISDCTKLFDTTITLQQRKLDLLKETKKGFLQKMFPKNGAKVPEVRFPGFTEDWEQRKLGDVLTVSKEKNKSNSYSKEQILSVSREVGTVNQIEYQGRSFAGADISGYKIVYPGQLIYTKSPLKGAPYGIFQLVTEEGIVSPLYAVYNSTEQALASFIGLQLKSDNIATHYLSPLVSKGAKNTINITDEGALDGRVTYPTITEQQKIVAFFKQLENTITLHQRKLDLLKETKKGFLQKMFV
ncbi:TPA: restriction endonuclease subunit S [Enterococcus faecium]